MNIFVWESECYTELMFSVFLKLFFTWHLKWADNIVRGKKNNSRIMSRKKHKRQSKLLFYKNGRFEIIVKNPDNRVRSLLKQDRKVAWRYRYLGLITIAVVVYKLEIIKAFIIFLFNWIFQPANTIWANKKATYHNLFEIWHCGKGNQEISKFLSDLKLVPFQRFYIFWLDAFSFHLLALCLDYDFG